MADVGQIGGSVAEHFDSLRERMERRIADAVDQFGVTAAPPVPSRLHLAQNHPNPFNPLTTVTFTLEKAGIASLRIFDASGRLVRTLFTDYRDSGAHAVLWDGRDDGGRQVGDGVYLYRLDAAGDSDARKMVLVR